MRILVVDNYDSFTHNLVDLLERLGARSEVVMNDAADVAALVAKQPRAFVISPGPCTPAESCVSLELARAAVSGALGVPLFGVCLGLQAMAVALGGSIVRAARPLHGKTCAVHHRDDGIFAGLPSPFDAARYNSLLVDRDSLPSELEITAWTEAGEIMALRHTRLPVLGVQFHPESFLTPDGPRLVSAWLATLQDSEAGGAAA